MEEILHQFTSEPEKVKEPEFRCTNTNQRTFCIWFNISLNSSTEVEILTCQTCYRDKILDHLKSSSHTCYAFEMNIAVNPCREGLKVYLNSNIRQRLPVQMKTEHSCQEKSSGHKLTLLSILIFLFFKTSCWFQISWIHFLFRSFTKVWIIFPCNASSPNNKRIKHEHMKLCIFVSNNGLNCFLTIMKTGSKPQTATTTWYGFNVLL